MGMYTQLHYGAQLKADVPSSVIEILRYMVGEREEDPPENLPNDPLFKYSVTVSLTRR